MAVLSCETPSRRLLTLALAVLGVLWTMRLAWEFYQPVDASNGIILNPLPSVSRLASAVGLGRPNSSPPPYASSHPPPGRLPSPGNNRKPVPPQEIRLEGVADRVAMILDTKYTSHLIPLILHFASVLGPEWPIVFFTSQATLDGHIRPPFHRKHGAAVSAPWKRALDTRRVQVFAIPGGTDLTSRNGVNEFLSGPWLWAQLAPARHVLAFQADSVICSNSERTLADFAQYDFIGAPFHRRRPLFNGGLSLRNRTMMMEILAEQDYDRDMRSPRFRAGPKGEDCWFSESMRGRGGRLPEWDVAASFSVEFERDGGWHERPFGYHKVHKTMPGRLPRIREWCPEIDLAVPNYLKGEEGDGRG